MIAKRVTMEDARINLAELITRVRYMNERFLIEKHGRPVALVIPLSGTKQELEKLPDFFAPNLKEIAEVEVTL